MNSPAHGRSGELMARGGMPAELRQRRRTAWGIVFALAVFVALGLLTQAVLFPNDSFESRRRSSFSFRADGFRGLHEVLGALGYRVARHRRSYEQLPAAASALLVMLDPEAWSGLHATGEAYTGAHQEEALRDWISSGGHLLATLSRRRTIGAHGVETDLEDEGDASILSKILEDMPTREWTRIDAPLVGRRGLAAYRDTMLAPPAGAPNLVGAYLRWEEPRELIGGLTLGGRGHILIQTFSRPASPWKSLITLAGKPLVLERELGDGRIWLCSSAYPFTNIGLGLLGTGKLAFTLLDFACMRGHRGVVLDEYSHGLWAKRGMFGWVFATDLFYPVASVVLLVLLAAWRGAMHAGPPSPERQLPRRAKEEFVIGLAEIARRAGRHQAAAAWIVASYHARLTAELGIAESSDLEHLESEIAGRGRRFGAPELIELDTRARAEYERQRTAATAKTERA